MKTYPYLCIVTLKQHIMILISVILIVAFVISVLVYALCIELKGTKPFRKIWEMLFIAVLIFSGFSNE